MKYKASPLMETFSGSLADSTFSTGRGGDYIRRRVNPAQPRTAAQVAARSVFGTMSARWRTLTDAQRAGWRTLATSITLTDRYGKSYTPSGQQLFVGANATLANDGDELWDAPGGGSAHVPPFVGALVAKRGAAAANDVITVDVGTVAASERGIVSATAQFSAGRAYISPSQFRKIATLQPGAGGARDIKAAYEAVFGRPTIGQKIAVSVAVYDIAVGIKSAEVQALTTVVAV